MPILASPENPEPDVPQEQNSLPPELQGGDATKFGFALKSLVIQGDTPIDLASSGVTAIVGGNNVGKSTLLRQIRGALIGQASQNPELLTNVTVTKNGDPCDLAAWLLQHAHLVAGAGASPPSFHRAGVQVVNSQMLKHRWENDSLRELANHLVHHADARTRHTWTEGAARRNRFNDPPVHPIHTFEFDGDRRKELSAISEQAFGLPLTVDRLSGQVFFRVGTPKCESPSIDDPTDEYQLAMESLPPLNTQGDGMVFMLGALMPVVASIFPVILLDEPEAFLHPPQAYLMGRALADLAERRSVQLLVATHDRNILRGLLSSKDVDVSILRLTRDGDRTSARLLQVSQVRRISDDRVLKYTDILDGLFHRLVVLTENERDCLFYRAALDELATRQATSIRPHDVLFVPTNGKGNMAAMAEALKGTGVRIVASPDLDLLNNVAVVKKLVGSLGAEWGDDLEQLYQRATMPLQEKPQKRLNKDVLAAITQILSEEPDRPLDVSRQQRLREQERVDNPWNLLKSEGLLAMRADKTARDELVRRLDLIGVVLVKVGELENFYRDGTRSSKDAWLRDALRNEAQKGDDAQDHLRRILAEADTTATCGGSVEDI